MRVRVGSVELPRHQPVTQPTPMGHEYCGIVEEVGAQCVRSSRGSSSSARSSRPTTLPALQGRLPVRCQHRELVGGAQAPDLRVPLADGTLVATPDVPPARLIPSLLRNLGRARHRLVRGRRGQREAGQDVAVVGDGAVGLLGVLSAKQMGAERIIAMSRHESGRRLARDFGATDIVTERGDDGVARIKELTNGIGADSVLECVGTQESMMQANQRRRVRAGT